MVARANQRRASATPRLARRASRVAPRASHPARRTPRLAPRAPRLAPRASRLARRTPRLAPRAPRPARRTPRVFLRPNVGSSHAFCLARFTLAPCMASTPAKIPNVIEAPPLAFGLTGLAFARPRSARAPSVDCELDTEASSYQPTIRRATPKVSRGQSPATRWHHRPFRSQTETCSAHRHANKLHAPPPRVRAASAFASLRSKYSLR
jgi:hypothetical protein